MIVQYAVKCLMKMLQIEFRIRTQFPIYIYIYVSSICTLYARNVRYQYQSYVSPISELVCVNIFRT